MGLVVPRILYSFLKLDDLTGEHIREFGLGERSLGLFHCLEPRGPVLEMKLLPAANAAMVINVKRVHLLQYERFHFLDRLVVLIVGGAKDAVPVRAKILCDPYHVKPSGAIRISIFGGQVFA
jgi:hypothetical protein